MDLLETAVEYERLWINGYNPKNHVYLSGSQVMYTCGLGRQFDNESHIIPHLEFTCIEQGTLHTTVTFKS
jgi:hypothetical protein